jgi:hypothetical protein
MSKYGPNVTKLITKFIAREAVPPGGGLASALEFFGNAEQRKKVLDAAEAKAIQAIQLIKSAPDNPFGNDDEKIASGILEQIQERQLTQRALDTCPRCEGVGSYCDYIGVRQCGLCGGTGKCQ